MQRFDLAFGDLRDRLVAAVLAGDKTVTTSLHASYEVEGEPLPEPGLQALVDREDRPIGGVEVESVELRRLGDIDDTVAHGEGEGYSGVADWRESHERFWRSNGTVDEVAAARPGWQLDDDAVGCSVSASRAGGSGRW